MSDPARPWPYPSVINAAGTMTALGASRVPDRVRAAACEAMQNFVGIDEMQGRAGAVIARLTGAGAGFVTGCSAAGLAQAVAGAITGEDPAAVEALPDTAGRERRVIMQMGHRVNYGAPVEQAVRVTGADLVTIGTAAACETWHLAAALRAGAAAVVHVVSHHTVRENELPLDVVVGMAGAQGVPVIVDMAAEYDLRAPFAAGASAAVWSGHKFLSGPTSGILAGTPALIRAAYLQRIGIGRLMKAGKEAIAGAIAALEAWEGRDHAAAAAAEEARLALWEAALDGQPGLAVSRQRDWTGNPVTRLRLSLAPQAAGVHAWDLGARLAARRPRIMLRDDLMEHEELYLDPTTVSDDEARLVGEAIVEELSRARAGTPGPRRSWSEVKRERRAALLRWPESG